MRRTLTVALVLALALTPLGVAGCQKKVKVETGKRVVCVYGETLSENVKTIEVRARDAGRYSVQTETILCKRHRKAQELWAQAQTALQGSDYKAAKSALDKLVALDPKFAQGNPARQLAEINEGKKPKPIEGVPGAPGTNNGKPGGSTVPAPPALVDFAPDGLNGFKADPLVSDGISITRTYQPTGTSNTSMLTIVAQQYADVQLATAALDELKSQYPGNADDFKVSGRTAYFGTYSGFGLVVFVDGRTKVAIEGLSRDSRPEKLKGMLTSIAEDLLR